jgi:pSer/pThr/pTyr-binding forkhead associated (FHA) protein
MKKNYSKKPEAVYTISEHSGDGPVAWLVVHTEGLPVRSYPLMEGETAVGRKEVSGRTSITIPDDPYVSRYHCAFIIAPARGQLGAAVADDGRYQQGRVSVNGTYLNGNEARISVTRIKDHDTIQIGQTKLVFKWNLAALEDIEDEVSHTTYVKTVEVDK